MPLEDACDRLVDAALAFGGAQRATRTTSRCWRSSSPAAAHAATRPEAEPPADRRSTMEIAQRTEGKVLVAKTCETRVDARLASEFKQQLSA